MKIKLSLLLVLALLVTMLPAWALSEGDSGTEQTEQAEVAQTPSPGNQPERSADPYTRDESGRVLLEVDLGGSTLYDGNGKNPQVGGFDLVSGAKLTVSVRIGGGKKDAKVKARVSIADLDNPDVDIAQKTVNKASTKGKTEFTFKAKDLKALRAGKSYSVYLQTGKTKNIAGISRTELFSFTVNSVVEAKANDAPDSRRVESENDILDAVGGTETKDLRLAIGVTDAKLSPATGLDPAAGTLNVAFTLTGGTPGGADLPGLKLRVENAAERSLISKDITLSGSFDDKGNMQGNLALTGTDLSALSGGQTYAVKLDVLEDPRYKAGTFNLGKIATKDDPGALMTPKPGTFAVPGVYVKGSGNLVIDHQGDLTSPVESANVKFILEDGRSVSLASETLAVKLTENGRYSLSGDIAAQLTAAPAGSYDLYFEIAEAAGRAAVLKTRIGSFKVVDSLTDITIAGTSGNDKTYDLAAGGDGVAFGISATRAGTPISGVINVAVYVGGQPLDSLQAVTNGTGSVTIPASFMSNLFPSSYDVQVSFDGDDTYAAVPKAKLGTLKVTSSLDASKFSAEAGSDGYVWTNGRGKNLEIKFTLKNDANLGTSGAPIKIAGVASIRNASGETMADMPATFSFAGTNSAAATVTFTPTDLYKIKDGSYSIYLSLPMINLNSKLSTLKINDGLAFGAAVDQNKTFVKNTTTELSFNVKFKDGAPALVPFTLSIGNDATMSGEAKGDGSDGGVVVKFTNLSALAQQAAGVKRDVTLSTIGQEYNITGLKIGEVTVSDSALRYAGSTDMALTFVKGVDSDHLPITITLADGSGQKVAGTLSIGSTKFPISISSTGSGGLNTNGDTKMTISKTDLGKMALGTHDITLTTTASDADPAIGPIKLGTLRIESVPVITAWTNNKLPGGTVGSSYLSGGSSVVVRVSAAPKLTSSGVSVSKGSLPSGLKLRVSNAGNIVVYGKPTQAGTYTFTLKAKNKHGSDTQSFSITVTGSSTATTGESSDTENTADPGTVDITAQGIPTDLPASDLVSLGAFQMLSPATLDWVLAREPLVKSELLKSLLEQQPSANVAYPLVYDENLAGALYVPIVGAGQYLLGQAVFERAEQDGALGFVWTLEPANSWVNLGDLTIRAARDLAAFTDGTELVEVYEQGDFIPADGVVLVQLQGSAVYDAADVDLIDIDPDVTNTITDWMS